MNKTIKPHYENLVIGFGKGGKSLAAYLANHGQEVALVERSADMYGGSCINIACIPTKSLIVSAEHHTPYAQAHRDKNELTALLRKQNLESLAALPHATVITGDARFTGPKQVRVTVDGTEHTVTATRIFINTGCRPNIPPIEGVRSSKHVFTSTSLMERPELVERLIVIGAGFIGLEFANMFAKFGAEVVVLNHGAEFLPREDADVAEEIHKVLSGRKIRIINGVTPQGIIDLDDHRVSVKCVNADGTPEAMEASAVLVATGRVPVTSELNLEATGVKTDQRGYIAVDEQLRTSHPEIWAIGDVNGGPQFTYISFDDYKIIRDQLFGGGLYVRVRTEAVPDLRLHHAAAGAHRVEGERSHRTRPSGQGGAAFTQEHPPGKDPGQYGRLAEGGGRCRHQPDPGVYLVLRRGQ
jgi:pyruvate/2-oxoglutarate dehydrogenase complex dihydrolipoamide dehydrogenase (E3) component